MAGMKKEAGQPPEMKRMHHVHRASAIHMIGYRQDFIHVLLFDLLLEIIHIGLCRYAYLDHACMHVDTWEKTEFQPEGLVVSAETTLTLLAERMCCPARMS